MRELRNVKTLIHQDSMGKQSMESLPEMSETRKGKRVLPQSFPSGTTTLSDVPMQNNPSSPKVRTSSTKMDYEMGENQNHK